MKTKKTIGIQLLNPNNMLFIQVTESGFNEGTANVVNLSNVFRITPSMSNKGSYIYFSATNKIEVKETYEELVLKLEANQVLVPG